jgi:formylglycine-generating enzyme required for sulfatase activity
MSSSAHLGLDHRNFHFLKFDSSKDLGFRILMESEDLGKIYENCIGVKMIKIPKGKFLVEDRDIWSKVPIPVSKIVSISKSFYISESPITVEQYSRLVGYENLPEQGLNKNEINYKGNSYPLSSNTLKDFDNFPVTFVSWEDSVDFCEQLSVKEGKTYRLPSSMEWEYACKGNANVKLIDILKVQSAVYICGDSSAIV